MARTLFVDLRHAEEANGRSPGAAQRLSMFLGAIVQAATTAPSGEPVRTAVACRHARRRRSPCRDLIVAQRLDVPAEIRWHCPACGEDGVITGWRGSEWDRRGARERAEDVPDPRDIARQVLEEAAAAGADPPSIDELNARLAARMDEYNRAPQAALGGLAPEQVARLIYSDWTSPESAVRVDERLTLDELVNVPLVANARNFLRALLESGGARATQTGNLNRRFVARLVESFVWLEDDLEPELIEDRKTLNEPDAPSLHILRVLLEVAQLIARRKGTWRVTARGRGLLADERAGELCARLFRTHFLEFNLAYRGLGPEAPGLQQTIAYTLYRFGQVAEDWQSRDALVRQILLPKVRDEVPAGGLVELLPFILRRRVLAPLEEFGLAASRTLHPLGRDDTELVYRKTRLFDRLLHFDLG